MDNYTILAVEDHILNWELLKKVLGDYTLIHAKDGEQALKILEKQKLPDLILLDIVMPGKDGYEIIKILKENDRTRDIPVVFITGLNSVKNEEEGLNLGAVDYIVKPFNPAIVQARIRNTLKFRSQQKLLEKLAHIDGLTEIPNRRNFDITLAREFKSAARNKRWLSLIMIDVDSFKHFNDSYGHARGDEALIKIAGIIQSCLKRPLDFVARYGGEEFSVILPDTDESGGRHVAERIRQAVENLNIEHKKDPGSPWLTISLGGCSMIPNPDQNSSVLVEKADACLYKAKTSSGNRVIWADRS